MSTDVKLDKAVDNKRAMAATLRDITKDGEQKDNTIYYTLCPVKCKYDQCT